jgi:hypothetical protein
MLPCIALGIQINVYERTGGIPSTTQLAAALQDRIDSYTHTIANAIGFETMTCGFACTLEEGIDWLANGLGRSCEVSGPDCEIVWEGFLETIEVQFGQERRSVSLREMANRIRVGYQTVLGTQGVRPTASTFFQDADSIALFGKKDLALAIGNTSDGTEVDDYGTIMLAKLKDPLAAPSSTVASGDLGEIRITLTFAGWYTTLDWLLVSNTSTTKTTTTTQIGTLLTAAAAINNFISTATTNITASGVTATEYIEPDTTYRAKIEALLARGNGADPYAWGVYESREFYAAPWAGAGPEAITYQRHLGESEVLDSFNMPVAPWMVRPDAMYQVIELLDVAPVVTQQDAAGRFYVARVTCSISEGQISVQLEPEQSSNLEAVLITRYL